MESPRQTVDADLEKIVISQPFHYAKDDVQLLKAKLAIALAEYLLQRELIKFKKSFNADLQGMLMEASIVVYDETQLETSKDVQ